MSADLLALCCLCLLPLHALCSALLGWDGGALAGEVAALVEYVNVARMRACKRRRRDRYG